MGARARARASVWANVMAQVRAKAMVEARVRDRFPAEQPFVHEFGKLGFQGVSTCPQQD